ncbi:MAG: ABC transporter permease [Alphaproteobacteria bacterium]
MFPEDWRIPLERWIDQAFDWILDNFAGLFTAVKTVLTGWLRALDAVLLGAPWWAVLLALFALTWAGSRRIGAALAVTGCMAGVGLLGLWEMGMQTLSLMIVSTGLAVLLGFPAGLLMAYNGTARTMMRPVLDLMQTLPSLVFLVPAIILFGLGKVPAILATVIYASPPLVRLTDLGLRRVDRDVAEAARAFGANWWQRLIKVELPLALPSIRAGINQTTMLALSMVVIASMIGVQGLGQEVLLGLNRLEVGRGVTAGLAIVLIAIVLDRITQAWGGRADRLESAGDEKAVRPRGGAG